MAQRVIGLFTPRRRAERILEERAAERREQIGGLDIGLDELLASTADPAEAKAWQDQFNSYRGMALSDDGELQREGLDGLAKMAEGIRGAVDRRQQAQSEFVIEQARELREQHQRAVAPMRELQSNMEQLNQLLADPEFNQNLPINRGYLLELLKGSTRQMLSDPEDFADALTQSGGGGLISSLVRFAGGVMAAEDFNFTKEDYARLARAMYTFNEQRYQKTVAPLEMQAAALEQAAGGLGFLPPGYSLTQYVTGSPEKFENPLQGDYGAGFAPTVSTPPLEQAGETALEALGLDNPESDPERAAAGPQFGGVPRSQVGVLTRLFGYEDQISAMNRRIEELGAGGATIKADPETGGLFAIYQDGRREEIATSRLQKSYVLEGLKAGQRSVRGVIRR